MKGDIAVKAKKSKKKPEKQAELKKAIGGSNISDKTNSKDIEKLPQEIKQQPNN